MYLNPDKIRFLDQDQKDYSVTAIEVSDERSFEHFITVWIRAGHEDKLWKEIGECLWKNKEDKFRHVPSIFHRDDLDSKWSVTLHHYHIPYEHQPTLSDLMTLIDLINSVTDRKYISPELINGVKKVCQIQ